MTIVGPDPLTAARPDRPAAATRRLRFIGPGFWQALWHSRSGKIGVILVGITLLGALVSLLGLAPYDPQAQDTTAILQGPSLDHLLGTDQFGRDVFSLVLEGIVVSLEIAVLATLIAGGDRHARRHRRRLPRRADLDLDHARAATSIFAIPAILLALAIVTALGAGHRRQRARDRHRLHPDLRARRPRPGAVAAQRRLRARRAGARLLAAPAPPSPHPPQRLRRHRRPDEPGARLGDPRRGEPQLPRARAAAADRVARPDGVTTRAASPESRGGRSPAPSLAIVIAVIGFNFLGDGLRDAADPRSRRS